MLLIYSSHFQLVWIDLWNHLRDNLSDVSLKVDTAFACFSDASLNAFLRFFEDFERRFLLRATRNVGKRHSFECKFYHSPEKGYLSSFASFCGLQRH